MHAMYAEGNKFSQLHKTLFFLWKKVLLKRYLFNLLLLSAICSIGLFSCHVWEISHDNKKNAQAASLKLESLFEEIEHALTHCERRDNLDTKSLQDIDPLPPQVPHAFLKKGHGNRTENSFTIEGHKILLHVDVPSFENYYGVKDVHISQKKLTGRENLQLPRGTYLSYALSPKHPFASFFSEKKSHICALICGACIMYLCFLSAYGSAFLKAKRIFENHLKTLAHQGGALEKENTEQKSMISHLEETLSALRYNNTSQRELYEFFQIKRSARLEKLYTLCAVLLEVLDKEKASSQVKFLAKELLSCTKTVDRFEASDLRTSVVNLSEPLSRALSFLDIDIKRKCLNLDEVFASNEDILFETDPYLFEIYLVCCFSRMIQNSFKGSALCMRGSQGQNGLTLIVERKGRGCGDEGMHVHMFKALPFMSTHIFENIGHLLGANAVFTHEEMRIQINFYKENQGNVKNVVPLFA